MPRTPAVFVRGLWLHASSWSPWLELFGRAGIGIGAAPLDDVGRAAVTSDRAISLTAGRFHRTFGGRIARDESDRLHERWSVPAPGRLLPESAGTGVAAPCAQGVHNGDRGPLLLLVAGADRTEPVSARATVGTDVVEFPDRGRSLVIDAGWHDVAESCLTWLDAHQL